MDRGDGVSHQVHQVRDPNCRTGELVLMAVTASRKKSERQEEMRRNRNEMVANGSWFMHHASC